MPTVIASILSIIGNVFGNISEEQKLKLTLAIQQDANFNKLLIAQSETNTEEAKSSNIIVAGWRPFIGWVCGLGFAWAFVIQPILTFIAVLLGHPIVTPAFDTGKLISILTGMLGLGS